jgi:uncharacterized protein YjiS (DUF1127 family)
MTTASLGLTSIFRTVSAMAGRMEAARQRRRTARMLEALPSDVLKDIGYRRDPDGHPTRVLI